MTTKKILSWLLLLFGEAIIIAAFIFFRGELTNNIFVLNIVVSSLVYCSFFIDILVSWIDFNDKSQYRIGSLGIRWLATWLYAVCAIIVMVVMNGALRIEFFAQIIIHSVLFFLFLLGLFGSQQSSDKVKNVYTQEIANRNGINEMQIAIRHLKEKINELDALPEKFIQHINTFEENARFLSPANNQEAVNLETSFVEIVNEIKYAISDYSMNEGRIESNLKKLEHIYQSRKNIYSN